MNAWVANCLKPSWWCRLFHRGAWISNDFGTWHVQGRDSFEVLCCKCGRCWTEPSQ